MLELMAKKTPKINKNVTTITMSISATDLSNVREIMLKTSVGKISTIDHLRAIFSIGFIAARGVNEDEEPLTLDHVIICGIEAHVCVLQTAINLSKNKKNTIYVVQDAVSSRYEKDYLTALSRLNKYSNIEIVSCEMVVFEWLRKSRTEEFKTISQLIK